MTIDAKRAGRIDVWPSRDDAQSADTEESKVLGRMTVWPTSAAARAHTSLGGGGGGGGGSEFVLQLGGENLQMGGEDLTLGA